MSVEHGDGLVSGGFGIMTKEQGRHVVTYQLERGAALQTYRKCSSAIEARVQAFNLRWYLHEHEKNEDAIVYVDGKLFTE